jgi:hypothetical protein
MIFCGLVQYVPCNASQEQHDLSSPVKHSYYRVEYPTYVFVYDSIFRMRHG